MARKSYEERQEGCKNPLLRKLFSIIIEKKSNLCVAADFDTLQETLDFIDRCAEHICIIKTHCDTFKDAEQKESLAKIYAKKKAYNFLLFEDAKYADIPKMTGKKYEETCMKYADLVTMYPLGGDDSFEAFNLALKGANLPAEEHRGCLAVCELSIGGTNIASPEKFLADASRHPEVCIGIIAQGLQVPDDCQMIKATPGVHMSRSDGGLSQKWKTPSNVVAQGSDIVIVGRGITASPVDEQEKICCQYKEAAYNAYLDSLNSL